jgi:hypothetical protein
MPLWASIPLAVLFGIMIWRLWPALKHHQEHGPKGTAKDWQGLIIPLLLVVGFVILLVLLVKK